MFQLLTLKGMDANRIDMVLFGAIIVRELMTASGATSLIVCDTSIRDGLALEALMARKDSNQFQLAR